MAIQRSIATRLIEGIQRDLLADADLAARWNSRVFLSPLVGDDGLLTCPQIGIIHRATSFAPGTSGVDNTMIDIVITTFEPYSEKPLKAGDLNGKDYLEHIEKVIANGTDKDGQGKVVDPDNPSSPSSVTRLLNVSSPTFAQTAPVRLQDSKGGYLAIAYSTQATFMTRLDNVTRARK